MLVDPPALRAGFSLPASDGALIEVEGDVFGLGEGPPTAFAAITALLVAMDHEVAFSRTTVGAAAPVVTELLVRVHADTHPLFGGQRPNKDAAGPAYGSTQPSSTLPWGGTIRVHSAVNLADAEEASGSGFQYDCTMVLVYLSACVVLWIGGNSLGGQVAGVADPQ